MRLINRSGVLSKGVPPVPPKPQADACAVKGRAPLFGLITTILAVSSSVRQMAIQLAAKIFDLSALDVPPLFADLHKA